MEERQTLPRPGDEALDPEVFRRVWDRVMEGRAAGPLVPLPARTARQAEEKADEPDELAALARDLVRGRDLAQSLARRTGSRALNEGAGLLRRTERELTADRFLQQGVEERTARTAAEGAQPLLPALRTLYRWSVDWWTRCRALAEKTPDPLLAQRLEEWGRRGIVTARAARETVEALGRRSGTTDR